MPPRPQSRAVRQPRVPADDVAVEDGTVEVRLAGGESQVTKRLRGWAFGSDGSHGEATLSQNGGSWIAETRSVSPDGSLVSALNVYTYDGTSRCTWRSLPTQLGSGHAAELVVTLVRQEAAKP